MELGKLIAHPLQTLYKIHPGSGNIVPQDITIEYTKCTCIVLDLQSNNIKILTYGELHILTDFFEKKK